MTVNTLPNRRFETSDDSWECSSSHRDLLVDVPPKMELNDWVMSAMWTWLFSTIFALLGFLIPAVAAAQQSPPTPSSATQPVATLQSLSNDCTQFYPQSAAKARAEGTTLVSVRIEADGTIHQARVATSSGNADLDSAAVTCVNGARTSPIMSGGVPIETETAIHVIWRRSYFTGAPLRVFANCNLYYPPVAVREHHTGETGLSFMIEGDGAVRNVSVAKSSGYDELDQAATDCVSSYKYQPVEHDGKPIEVDGKIVINWRLQ